LAAARSGPQTIARVWLRSFLHDIL
jgi:hypothetical protein